MKTYIRLFVNMAPGPVFKKLAVQTLSYTYILLLMLLNVFMQYCIMTDITVTFWCKETFTTLEYIWYNK